MRLNSSENTRSYSTNYYAFCLRSLSKKNTIRVLGLNRMRKVGKEADCKRKIETETKVEMEIKNLKLYMENQSIMEENQKLRKKALLLHQENQALLSQLQHKLSHQQNNSMVVSKNLP